MPAWTGEELNRITRFNYQLILFTLMTVVVACAPAPMPILTPTAAPPTPTMTSVAATPPPAPAILPTPTSLPPTAAPATATFAEERSTSMQINITLDDRVITATLNDSKTTRDFIDLLPLTLTLEDYAQTEKISDLPRRLSTESAPAGSDPAVGDIAYYAPWGNLALFYRDAGYANGLVLLGKLDSDTAALNVGAMCRRRFVSCSRIATAIGCISHRTEDSHYWQEYILRAGQHKSHAK